MHNPSESPLTAELQNNYKDFLEILTQNNDRYVLCVPPNRIVMDKCEIDPMFIQEHILEILGDTDYRSLKGKVYKAFDHELHLVSQNEKDKEVFCSILSNDIFFIGQEGLSIKRYMVSNTLDQRFYEKLENAFLDDEG